MRSVSTAAGVRCWPGVPPPFGTSPQAARPDGGRATGREAARSAALGSGTVRVERQLIRITGQGLVFTETESAAGKRTVIFPKLIAKDLRAHIQDFAQDGDDGLIFVGPDDGPM
ncbi:hypothetical protein ACQP25_00315 [Microtetraspora malaysiensis]|uniref:hypothetical protein n=1 Tax=Microtetraspora malaysiensis TaxID=161358 RepID=UPI003D8D0445